MSDIIPKDSCDPDALQRPKRRSNNCGDEEASAKKHRSADAPIHVTLAEETHKDYDSEVSELYNETFHGRETDYIDSSGCSDIEEEPAAPPPLIEIVEYEIASATSTEECFINDSTSGSDVDWTMNANGPNRPIGPYIPYAPTRQIHPMVPVRNVPAAPVESAAPVDSAAPVKSAAPVTSTAACVPIASVAPVASVGAVAPVASVGAVSPIASVGAVAPIASVGSIAPIVSVASVVPVPVFPVDLLNHIPSISDYDSASSSGYHDDGSTDSGPSDSDHDLADFWKCARCNYKQNCKDFRFCDNCYAIRMKHYPKRPKGRKHKLRRKSGVQYPRPRAIPKLNSTGGAGSSGQSNGNKSNQDERVKQGPSNNENNLNVLQPVKKDSGVSSSGSSQDIENVSSSSSHECTDMGIDMADSQATTVSKTTVSSEVSTSYLMSQASASSSQASVPLLQPAIDLPLSEASTSSSGVPVPSCSGLAGSFERNLELLSARAIRRRSGLITEEESNLSSDLCMMCSMKPKNGVFVHKKICHICCCYGCAVKIWNERRQCPICNGKVSNVMQLFQY